MSQLIISALGPDRPGIVGELTAHLHAAGGNILDSRMVNLRGEFAILILLECDESAAAKMRADHPRAGESMNLRLSIAAQNTARLVVEGMRYRLKTYSMDQPGIVARLTKILREHGGDITVETKPGFGCRFLLNWPRIDDEHRSSEHPTLM